MITGRHDQRGSLMLEIIVSVGVLALFCVAIGGIVVANARVVTTANLETRATAIAREGMEEVIAIKQASWSGVALTSPTNTYIVQKVEVASPYFELHAGPSEQVDSFTRTITMTQGMRDAGTQILSDAGTLPDPNTRKVIVSVTWDDRGTHKSVSLVSYLTNWKGES